MAVRSNIDCAREFLRTRGLDKDTLSFLCVVLDDCVDLNSLERQEFLEAYLEAEDLEQLLKLLPAVSCTAAQANVGSKCDETSGEVAKESTSRKAAEEKQEVQHIMEDCEAREQASPARQVVLASVQGGAVREEASFSDGVGLSGIEAQEQHFQEAGSIKKGQYVMIKNQPCRVVQIDKTSKIWKGPHRGCFQSHIIARGIFTGKKEDVFLPVTQKVTMPFVKREECQVIDIGKDGELSLLTTEYDTKDDVNLPTGTESDSELAKRIQTGFAADDMVVVIVLSTCECAKVVECKIMDASSQKMKCSRQR